MEKQSSQTRQQYDKICQHEFAPLGFEKISTDDTKVEVVAAAVCTKCSMFRTKILYFDRQKDQDKTQS